MLGFLTSLIPPWGRFAALAVVLAVVGMWHVMQVHEARVEGRKEIQAKWDAAEAERDRIATADRLRMVNANLGVQDAYRKRVVAANAAASAAQSELDRLRDEIVSGRPETTGTPAGTDDARDSQLLVECASRYTEVAREADRLATKVTGLQEYVSQVCFAQ